MADLSTVKQLMEKEGKLLFYIHTYIFNTTDVYIQVTHQRFINVQSYNEEYMHAHVHVVYSLCIPILSQCVGRSKNFTMVIPWWLVVIPW